VRLDVWFAGALYRLWIAWKRRKAWHGSIGRWWVDWRGCTYFGGSTVTEVNSTSELIATLEFELVWFTICRLATFSTKVHKRGGAGQLISQWWCFKQAYKRCHFIHPAPVLCAFPLLFSFYSCSLLNVLCTSDNATGVYLILSPLSSST